MKLFNANVLSVAGILVASNLVCADFSRASADDATLASRNTAPLCTGHRRAVIDDSHDRPQTVDAAAPPAVSVGVRAVLGRVLFYDRGCIVCHSVRNAGGHVGPALDSFSRRHNREYLLSRLRDTEYVVKLNNMKGDVYTQSMPPSCLTHDQAESLADFVMGLP